MEHNGIWLIVREPNEIGRNETYWWRVNRPGTSKNRARWLLVDCAGTDREPEEIEPDGCWLVVRKPSGNQQESSSIAAVRSRGNCLGTSENQQESSPITTVRLRGNRLGTKGNQARLSLVGFTRTFREPEKIEPDDFSIVVREPPENRRKSSPMVSRSLCGNRMKTSRVEPDGSSVGCA
ncbi:hypothetical protein QAD02_013525 [Eretmocerus hayati]|uniref:Uncharacterized protein n=3 Tax=Eretmocerus hayati TaxID=131215 RepID=A0ACC2P2S3_9HYME|nr:hypothetical protein QAD02_013521 [Eretmocerus hayati]KAJ8677736.1 hypothetical protein QAD02_013523 [Eretmocerus hayati]KAJ8677738.1 hypothetical protein QAD02_013525 [Eretmocerus hayati]